MLTFNIMQPRNIEFMKCQKNIVYPYVYRQKEFIISSEKIKKGGKTVAFAIRVFNPGEFGRLRVCLTYSFFFRFVIAFKASLTGI